MPVHFVTKNDRTADRGLLAHEVRHDPAELSPDNVAGLDDAADLAEQSRRLLGKRSPAARAKEAIKDLDASDRPAAGRALSEYQAAVADLLEGRRAELALRGGEARDPTTDLTVGGHGRRHGHLHLVTQVRRELEDIFVGLGYRVAEGPEVEDDWHNFEALNIPPAHPARSMQDTIYVALGADEQTLLRTHTSAMQIRYMKTFPPPVRIIVPGRVYRRDNLDLTHTPMFQQFEVLVVDEDITMADLKGTFETMLRALFGDVKVRLRPSFFPYTEPSAEIDLSCWQCDGKGCQMCKGTGWIELGGCGMVHPAVFEAVGYDAERLTGFAWGLGIERMAILRHQVADIRLFYENDLRFLEQFEA